MKKVLLFSCISILAMTGISQEQDSVQLVVGESARKASSEEVFTIVESMPRFNEEENGLQMYLAQNLRYPPKAKAQGIQGKVYVNFTVGKDGKVKDAKILRGVHSLLDTEALRLVNEMPNWIPGSQRGHNVAVSYNLPIGFKLGTTAPPANMIIEDGKIVILTSSEADEDFRIALSHQKKVRYLKAIEYYTKGLEKDPKHINSYYNRGLCYIKRKDFVSGCADLKKAKELGATEVEELIKKYCN